MKRDLNQAAARIVDIATGEAPRELPAAKNEAAVALGRLGGLKGGKVRADNLSDDRKREIASKAARARWTKP